MIMAGFEGRSLRISRHLERTCPSRLSELDWYHLDTLYHLSFLAHVIAHIIHYPRFRYKAYLFSKSTTHLLRGAYFDLFNPPWRLWHHNPDDGHQRHHCDHPDNHQHFARRQQRIKEDVQRLEDFDSLLRCESSSQEWEES